MMRRGSALLMALWIIAVLSVMVLSFSTEAKMQGGINVYVREKNRVKRLVEPGKILGEMILVSYRDVKDWQADEDEKELFEEDRWYKEKRDLKGGEGTKGGECIIGPILLDEDDPESGTVTVEIKIANDGMSQGININEFYTDETWDRWRIILGMIGLDWDDGNSNFTTKDGKSINLVDHVIAGWMDYRDEDDDVRRNKEGVECGAEAKEYEEFYDDHDEDYAEEDRFSPANGPIADIKELARVKIFQEYPAILIGGPVNPWEDEDNQLVVSNGGLLGLGIFGVGGGVKFNVNHCNKNLLLTVPGVYASDEIDEEDKSESEAAADAILECLKIKPQDSQDDDEREFYPYKDFNDMCNRVADEYPDVEIGTEAGNYVLFGPDENMVFTMTITASSMGMEYVAECDCYVDSNKKVRYTRWKE